MLRTAKRNLTFFLGACSLVALGAAPSIGASCLTASEQAINSTVAMSGSAPGVDEQCLWARLDSSGLIALEVAQLGPGSVSGRLSLYDQRCEPIRVTRQDRRPNRVVAWVESAGDYFYCFAADVAGQTLGELRVVQAFLPDQHSLDDRDEDEPDPNPLFSSALAGGPNQRDPGDRDEDEPDPNPLGAGDDLLQRGLARLCDRARTDDHGDASWCATALRPGEALEAMISGPGDLDVFALAMMDVGLVDLSIDGEVEVTLLDDRGVSLVSTADTSRIVRSVAEGIYYLRVSAGSTAGYSLSLSR